MKNPLKIYIDRLKNDDIEEIFEVISPSHLSLDEENLQFLDTITISGRAYLANHHLILDLKLKAKAKMPCSICNEPASFSIQIDDFSHTIEISEVRSAVWDYSDEVRSAILIRIPHFFECHEGQCPQRKTVNKYLKSSSEETYTPFSNLE